MPSIPRTEDNLVDIPLGVSVSKKTGFVYYNTDATWVHSKSGDDGYGNHTKKCIGIAINPSNWRDNRRMYANQFYYTLFGRTSPADKEQQKPSLPKVYAVYPERSDCISVGLYAVVKTLADNAKLTDTLADVFGSENTSLILDLAMYMLSANSAVFQHYPHWAKSHALFSEVIRSDSYISDFEKEMVSLSEINLFKRNWARLVLDDGQVFVCYDSTNVNSQAEGIFIVQKGHAKDDPDKDQVNTEYTIRQRDGMPVTFKNFPGSINDMSEATDMITELKALLPEGDKTLSKLHIVVIADRGYVSQENIDAMREAGIGYILMLKKNMDVVSEVLDRHIPEVKTSENYDEETGRFGITFSQKLFEDDDKDTYFGIVWDGDLERKHRATLMKSIAAKEARLQKAIERHTRMTDQELGTYWEFFDVKHHKEGTLQVNMRGKGTGRTKTDDAYVVDSYERNTEAINAASNRCGYMVIVSSENLSAMQMMQAMSKRDCVEKTFRALKSSLGMDKMGVHFEPSMHTKSLIWFVASILHALIFTKTEKLRAKDRKHGTVPALVDQYEEVTADLNLQTRTYERRYKLTKMQRQSLTPCGVSLAMIDQVIEDLPKAP